MRMCFSGRCQPRGLTTIVASSPSGRSAYDLPSSLVKSMVLSRASLRLSWPSIMFDHSGVLASSKSASQTLAPELSALIVIFLSVGPVISTRRSTRPAAGGATRQVVSSRMCAVSGRKSNIAPWLSSACRRRRPAGAERVVQRHQQFQGLRGQDLVIAVSGGPGDLHALRHSRLLLAIAVHP